MGRPKGFDRDELLNHAIQVFWKKGFADTSLQDLEKATGVNKSGLYSEFKSKNDLFVSSVKHYLANSQGSELLSREPLGWKNIEDFLLMGSGCEGQKGCFIVNTIREAAILPAAAKSAILANFEHVHELLMKNVKATGSKRNPKVVTDLILTLNAGLCLEQNLRSSDQDAKRVREFIEFLK